MVVVIEGLDPRPHCQETSTSPADRPRRSPIMRSRTFTRRSSALVLAGALAFGLAACSDDDAVDMPDVNVTEPAFTEEDTDTVIVPTETDTEFDVETDTEMEMGTETETATE
jgi:hypothetical protein